MACMSELVASLVGVDADVAAHVGERFSTMASVCTVGQYLDLRLAAQPLEDLGNEREAILETMRAKTASYTTVGPLAIGAALAGLSRADVDQWAAVGEPLGLAFQLRDDVLGVVGSAADTGKPAGDDLREGKRTLIMAHGLAHATANERRALVAAAGSVDPSELASAVEVLVRTGAIEAVEAEITAHVDLARERLDAIQMDASHRAALTALFEATAARVA
jgi:geranylgeranyl diphosphate synthase type I